MTSIHLLNVEQLKESFKLNMNFLHDILNKHSNIKNKLEDLKKKYSEMIHYNKKKIFIFCLDSYYFQYKMLIVEMENISKLIAMIKSRIYGDYYKLYNVIINETTFNIEDFSAKIKKFTPYKDIEPFYEYKNSDVIEIHNDILQILNLLEKDYLQKELKSIEYNSSKGLTVNNFIQTLNYENNVFKEKINLYVNYLQFYHKLQEKHLKNILTRITLFEHEIEEQMITKHHLMESNEEYKNNIISYLKKSEKPPVEKKTPVEEKPPV